MLARAAAAILSALLLLQPVLSAQQSQAPATAAATPNATQAAIRSTTRLVQVSVVVVDNHGNPITGLTKEDFSLTDQGAPQTISVFTAATPAPAAPVHFPPNMFTNRYDLKGQDPGAVTILLFDALNTSAEDQAYARKQVLQFLQSMKPQDHVALYALTTKLLILHDFTQDSTALVNAIARFTPKESASFDASNAAMFDSIASLSDAGTQLDTEALSSNADVAELATENLVISTANAISAIANHVSSVPGRKSLVWVSGGFPLSFTTNPIGTGAPDTTSFINTSTANDANSAGKQVSVPDINPAIRALNRSNISIYPVDVHGVEVGMGMSPNVRTPATALADQGFSDRRNRIEAFTALADRTGGVAFYGNNDLREDMRRASEDGRFAYTIGFYPNHNTWDGKFHAIKVQSKTAGVKLRYRQGYFAVPELAESEDTIKAALQDAAFSPLESTSLSLIVAVKSMEPAAERKVELRIALDPKQLLLQVSPDHRKGAVDIMFVQTSATGDVQSAEKQHFDVNLDDQQFAYMSNAGLILLRHVTISPQAAQLRVILRDAASGNLGSVGIPAKSLFPAATAAPTTAAPPASSAPTLSKPS